jgi:RNA polymerase-binding transcription factor DksA
MTKAELKTFETTLRALHARLRGDVSHLTSEALRTSGNGDATQATSNAPMHMADVGSDNFEQEFTFSLIQNQEQVLGEIADALERIKHGNFGRCEECKGQIAKARLQALPYTRHCVACARKIQQSQ